MSKKNNNAGGSAALVVEEKPKKPKVVAQVTLTVRDDGTIAGDFWVWEVDEIDRRKKWTVSGEDFFKYLYRVQPKNVRVIASCCNVQIVAAGLPEDQQGPWITNKGGKMRILGGDEIREILMAKSPVGTGLGTKLADTATANAEKAAGLPPAEVKTP